jgi:hypothetical protein
VDWIRFVILQYKTGLTGFFGYILYSELTADTRRHPLTIFSPADAGQGKLACPAGNPDNHTNPNQDFVS